MNRSLYTLIILLASALCCQAGTGLVREFNRTGQVTLYDYYFHSCRASLVVGEDSTGNEVLMLALLLEEGDINVNKGDELTLSLRDGSKIVLQCADDVRRGDVKWRRFKNGKIRYITCYYQIQWEQLERLKEMDCRNLILKTRAYEIKRNIKDVKSIFSKLGKQLVYR